MSIFERLKLTLTPVDPETVAAYQSVLPRVIHVEIKKDKGHLIARVDGFEDEKVKGLLITEAKDMNSLVSNVNDLIYTYVDMPTKIRPYYGELFKPEGRSQNSKELTLVKG